MAETFTDEEKVVLAEWERKRDIRSKLIDKLGAAEKNNDHPAMLAIMQEMIEVDGDYCEHGRSNMGTCGACDSLSRKYAKHMGYNLDELNGEYNGDCEDEEE